MDNKQAAVVLITVAQRAERRRAISETELSEASLRGADAIEFVEWLFEPVKRWPRMSDEWTKYVGPFDGFRAFCEARFEESNNA